MEERIIINLVDGVMTENGCKFSDYSAPRKANNASMYDYMASTYTGEYVTWLDQNKTAVETALEYLNDELHFKQTETTTVMDFYLQIENVHWEYDSENKVFYSIWNENGERTGDLFKINSVRKVHEGQRICDGTPIEF